MFDLHNKVIWLTGASSGIGEAVAIELAKKNVKLILSARRQDELERVRAQCIGTPPENIKVFPLDLTDAKELERATHDAIKLFGHIDVLINNGGISQRSYVHETSVEVFRRIMEVNFFGAISLSKYILPHFIERKQGYYVVLSSVTGKYGTPFRSGYAASKHALHGFYDSLAAEYWRDNIAVTMICPGVIKTPISLSALKGDGSPNNKMDDLQSKGMPVATCARQIVEAMANQKPEVYIGGKEVVLLYIKRFIPSLYRRIIKKIVVR
jgi:short-subunit dehydrogenase